MWPFNTKKKLTSDQFALVLIKLIGQKSGAFLSELQHFAEITWSDVEPDRSEISVRQLMIAYFWMVSRFFSADKKMLDELHERHFLACRKRGQSEEEKSRLGNEAQAEIAEKYAIYYKAWPNMDPDKGKNYFSIVSFEMAQSFFPKMRPALDMRLHIMIAKEIGEFIVQAKKLRQAVTISDS